jgi:signal transduction histidine kinase
MTLVLVCVIAVGACLRLLMELALQSKAQGLLQRERDRIARDIHDELGAELTQLVLQGEVMQSELPAGSTTRQQIDQLCERGRNLGRAMDEVVWAVNSRRDTLRDFTTYVCRYAQGFLGNTGIPCRLDVEMELPATPFDLPIRRNLFLAVKEALNNAAKYSHATELFLRIHRHGAGLRVIVEDNGHGFDPKATTGERNGLANMQARLDDVGGTCRVFSSPGAGCRVDFEIPRLHVRARPWWMKSKPARAAQPIRVAVPPTHIPSENPHPAET